MVTLFTPGRSRAGVLNLGNIFLVARIPWSVAFTAGNGFSLDNFVVTDTVPEPMTLLAVGSGFLAVGFMRRQRRRERSGTDLGGC